MSGALSGGQFDKRDLIVQRVVRELQYGFYVNLGIGMPSLVANHVLKGIEVIFPSANGMLGVGPDPSPGSEDPALSCRKWNKRGRSGSSVRSIICVRERWSSFSNIAGIKDPLKRAVT